MLAVGEPSERPGKVQSEIAEAKRHCKRSVYGVGAVCFVHSTNLTFLVTKYCLCLCCCCLQEVET